MDINLDGKAAANMLDELPDLSKAIIEVMIHEKINLLIGLDLSLFIDGPSRN